MLIVLYIIKRHGSYELGEMAEWIGALSLKVVEPILPSIIDS